MGDAAVGARRLDLEASREQVAAAARWQSGEQTADGVREEPGDSWTAADEAMYAAYCVHPEVLRVEAEEQEAHDAELRVTLTELYRKIAEREGAGESGRRDARRRDVAPTR